jgi:hypothetical protein
MSEMEKPKKDAATHEEAVLPSERQDSFNGDKATKPHPVEIKLDKHGLPLSPQPSDNEDDPLVICHEKRCSRR